MSSLVLMRILESAPARYDRGMQILTLGGWARAHRRLAEAAARKPGTRVLEIGCGTGALAQRLVERGARLVAIDHNPEMLDLARRRVGERAKLVECTASEIEGLADPPFDVVLASLVLSEMSPSERSFVLRASYRALRTGGRLVLADEVTPKSALARTLVAAVRLPLALLSWVVTGTVSHPLRDLEAEIADAGFELREFERTRLGTFARAVAERPSQEPGP